MICFPQFKVSKRRIKFHLHVGEPIEERFNDFNFWKPKVPLMSEFPSNLDNIDYEFTKYFV